MGKNAQDGPFYIHSDVGQTWTFVFECFLNCVPIQVVDWLSLQMSQLWETLPTHPQTVTSWTNHVMCTSYIMYAFSSLPHIRNSTGPYTNRLCYGRHHMAFRQTKSFAFWSHKLLSSNFNEGEVPLVPLSTPFETLKKSNVRWDKLGHRQPSTIALLLQATRMQDTGEHAGGVTVQCSVVLHSKLLQTQDNSTSDKAVSEKTVSIQPQTTQT